LILSALILILSCGLLFFYFQALCQRILRREFDRAYFQTIVHAAGLEFASLRQGLEVPAAPLDFAQCRVALQCDLLTLRYLLQHAANLRQSLTWQERLLMLYYRVSSAGFVVRHWLGMEERAAFVRIATILQYFANVVGERNFRLQTDTLGSWD
jgi:hypothetical protein